MASASSFSLEGFFADPSAYMGKSREQLEIAGGIPKNIIGSTQTDIEVQVQKEDNSHTTITEKFTYITLPSSICSRTIYIGRTPKVSNKATTITVSPNKDSANYAEVKAYYLMWEAGKAFAVRLGSEHDYFFTAKVNGCCLYISGSRETPLVMHANYDPKEEHTKDRLNLSDEHWTALSHEERGRELAKLQCKQYTRFYGNLAHKLIDDKIFTGGNVSVLDPEFYLKHGSFASMFGLRKNNQWTFYANQAVGDRKFSTFEIWPAVVGRMPSH